MQGLAVVEKDVDRYSTQESSVIHQAMKKPSHEASLEYRESTGSTVLSVLASGIPVVHGNSSTEVPGVSGSSSIVTDGASRTAGKS